MRELGDDGNARRQRRGDRFDAFAADVFHCDGDQKNRLAEMSAKRAVVVRIGDAAGRRRMLCRIAIVIRLVMANGSVMAPFVIRGIGGEGIAVRVAQRADQRIDREQGDRERGNQRLVAAKHHGAALTPRASMTERAAVVNAIELHLA